MGYNTEFSGSFRLDKPLTEEHAHYLTAFAETRRMKRFAAVAGIADPVREAVGLPIGPEGAYFVADSAWSSDGRCVKDHNCPPRGQPGLWCKWVPTADRQGIEWNGMEKFYDYIEWIRYLIEHFLRPWGYTVNGSVCWQGEEVGDAGTIEVVDNFVKSRQAQF